MKPIVLPVLIGADLNCYNVARAFHEAYGVISHAFGRYEISSTLASKIIRFHKVPSLDTDEVFLSELQAFAASNPDIPKIIIGCTDDYANLIARNKDALSRDYIIPYNDITLMDEFMSKERFYRACDRYGILYPKTRIIPFDADTREEDLTEAALGFAYPIIVKPSNSITYWKHPFDGMNKVYVSDSPAETATILSTIFASGYDDSVILQDMIPGNDAGMYVLTAYMGKDKKAKMMCLGHVLLEEHTPKGRGNHAAILTEYNPALTEGVRAFLEDIGYTGYANFDIKYDPRDNTYRFFEINLRQGRSNYYVTASGANIAAYLVGDYIENSLSDALTVIKEEHLWTSIPKGIIWKYTHNDDCVARARACVRAGKFDSSLWYRKDLLFNPGRLFYVACAQYRQLGKFKKYCKNYR